MAPANYTERRPTSQILRALRDEYEKICNELNKNRPGYDYHSKVDSFDGRITVSPKGVHFAATQYGFPDDTGFGRMSSTQT